MRLHRRFFTPKLGPTTTLSIVPHLCLHHKKTEHPHLRLKTCLHIATSNQKKDRVFSSWSNGKAMAMNAISKNLSPTSKSTTRRSDLTGTESDKSLSQTQDLRQTDATLKDQTLKRNRPM